ncbi:30S ribosome-binding factor RbfA [Sulfurospirillum sp. 1612]|uniref:30S ribosome-binding factor RbfA n=1 Tax=Sulfurospirillum sp. 1612 TaxID=3094835 RepID=UPI002F93EC52
MNDKSIKLQRTQSVLKELLPEALATLSDEMLSNLCVIDVVCSRGKYDAEVYLDEMAFDSDEKAYILKHLKKINRHLQNYCMQAEGWFRCPNFHFKFDESLKKQNEMDKLFEKIEKELHG